MPHSKGFRKKTRKLLSKGRHQKGLSAFLTEYKVQDKVVIKIDPSQVKGMPHRRFHGKVGTVEEVMPRSLYIRVPVGNKDKIVIARFEHIKLHKTNTEGTKI